MSVLASLAFATSASAFSITDEHTGQTLSSGGYDPRSPQMKPPYQCAAPCALTFTAGGQECQSNGSGGPYYVWGIENGSGATIGSGYGPKFHYDFPTPPDIIYTVWMGVNTSICGTSETARVQVLDKTPPDTTITSGPPSVTDNPTPTFAFSASEQGSAFTCRFDDQPVPWLCTSPVTAPPLTDGDHTFAVWATDAAGNADPTPATVAFRVQRAASGPPAAGGAAPPDSTAPRMSLTVAAQNLTRVLQHGLKTRIGCSEACTLDAKLLAKGSLRRRLNLPAKNALAHNTSQLTAAGSRLVTLKLTTRDGHALHALHEATVTLSVRATDTAGNNRTRTIAVHLRN